MERTQPKPGEYGVLMAMGPAFSAELVLLQWQRLLELRLSRRNEQRILLRGGREHSAQT